MHKDINIYKQNPLKKVLFLVFGLTLLIGMCTPISAFQVKYYGSHWEDTKEVKSLYDIPEKYFDGIKGIKVFEKSNKDFTAYYLKGGVIEFYNNKIEKIVLIEELAHNYQSKIEKNVFYLQHTEVFTKYYEEITNATA